MIKTTVIALVTAVAFAGLAAPSYAETNTSIGVDDFASDQIDDSNYATAVQNILSRLRDQGVDATSVEPWGGMVRAYVTLEDGRQVMQFYALDTLQQVAL